MEIIVSIKDIPEVIEGLTKLTKEIERLNNIINKAIDYLKSDNYWLSQVKANDELLNILKGNK